MSVKTIVHTDPTWYKVVAIIGLVFGAAAIAAVVLTQDDAVSELSASLSNRLNDHETTMTAQDSRIIKQENFNKMDATHLLALQATVDKLEESDAQQRVAIAILEARGDLTTQPSTQPTPSSTIDLRLKVSDNKGNFKSQGYPRDVPAILIQGESTFLKKSFLITIKDPNGAFVKDTFGETLSDGDISEAWIPTGTVTGGTYTVTIKIDLKTDSIQFTIL